MKLKNPTQRQRAYVYRVLVAAVPLLVAYGVVSAEDAALWLGAVAAVLGLGLAAGNTSPRE